jgi:large subunit ribosomal protein L44
MVWKPQALTPTEGGFTGERMIVGKVMTGLIGAIYLENGAAAAKSFIRKHIISRHVDMSVHVSLLYAMQKLQRITEKLNRPRPIARLLKESGRQSVNPVFLVGIYSGNDKIGEGYGSSLQMAQTRAAKDALLSYFLKETKEMEHDEFSDEDEDKITFFDQTA